jgi:hypothetical protein
MRIKMIDTMCYKCLDCNTIMLPSEVKKHKCNKMKNKTSLYWARLEKIALKEGDLQFALECQAKKIAAGQFVINKIK